MVDRASQGEEEAAKAAPVLLQEALNANLDFEVAVKKCLGLAV